MAKGPHSVKPLTVGSPVEVKGFWKGDTKGTGRVAKQGLPLHLQRHQFKPGLAHMRKLGRGR